MRFIVLLLLVVVLLPYLSYGQTLRRVDHENAVPQPVCVTNLSAGAICEFNAEPHQSMVMIRGQLLPVR